MKVSKNHVLYRQGHWPGHRVGLRCFLKTGPSRTLQRIISVAFFAYFASIEVLRLCQVEANLEGIQVGESRDVQASLTAFINLFLPHVFGGIVSRVCYNVTWHHADRVGSTCHMRYLLQTLQIPHVCSVSASYLFENE